MSAQISQISAIVCCRNAVTSIEPCLKSLKDSGVGELIVVDGGSIDGTVDIASQYADVLLFDEGTGLGAARNLGVDRASLDFILNSGPDNVYSASCLQNMLKHVDTTDVVGVSAMTRVETPKYLASLLGLYKKARFFSGERQSIGTPMLCRSKFLKENQFDERHRFSDDAELCVRWQAVYNARFFIADCEVAEVGSVSLFDIASRWKMYGISDYEVYKTQSSQWDTKRKIRSLLHPLVNELLTPLFSGRISAFDKIRLLWFLILITWLRYFNWARAAL